MRLITGICDRLQVLSSGTTLAEGSPEEIMSNADVIEAFLGKREVVADA